MAIKPNQSLAYRKVPEYLRLIRAKAGLTQRQVARRLRKNQWWVARCETGSRRVDVAEWVEFCRACGVDPKQALDELKRLSPSF